MLVEVLGGPLDGEVLEVRDEAMAFGYITLPILYWETLTVEGPSLASPSQLQIPLSRRLTPSGGDKVYAVWPKEPEVE